MAGNGDAIGIAAEGFNVRFDPFKGGNEVLDSVDTRTGIVIAEEVLEGKVSECAEAIGDGDDDDSVFSEVAAGLTIGAAASISATVDPEEHGVVAGFLGGEDVKIEAIFGIALTRLHGTGCVFGCVASACPLLWWLCKFESQIPHWRSGERDAFEDVDSVFGVALKDSLLHLGGWAVLDKAQGVDCQSGSSDQECAAVQLHNLRLPR